MKRLTFIVLSVSSLASAADRPFSAIETRPLWERPSNDGLSLQQRTESALDRGNGRIEDQPTFDVKQIERDQSLDLSHRSPVDVYRDERDRAEQIDEQRIRIDRTQDRTQRLERDNEALLSARRRWQQMIVRENAAGGAVVDKQALDRVEQQYLANLRASMQQRDADLATLDANRGLTPEQYRLQREGIIGRYNASHASATAERDRQRSIILGYEK